jgi:long-chain acyl-CoA synthetase
MTLKAVPRTREDVAFLQYTGGTTGVSKGATLLNRNIIANMLQVEGGCSRRSTLTRSAAQLRLRLPLYHIFALTVCNMIGMRTGSCNLLIPNPRDIPGFVKELSTFKFNIFPGLNTLFNALANNPEFAKLDFSTFEDQPRRRHGDAAPGGRQVDGADRQRHRRRLRPVRDLAGGDLQRRHAQGLHRHHRPADSLDRDRDPRRRRQGRAAGESGEICIRGPQVMAGYWQRPEETANVMTADGFFKSGDVGIMDETGATRIVDRKKDMVLVSGFNVYPSEIEEVAMTCPGVMEAAVIGVPDEHSGEVPKIFIVKKDPEPHRAGRARFPQGKPYRLQAAEVHRVPSRLPKTPVGKILRRALRPKA